MFKKSETNYTEKFFASSSVKYQSPVSVEWYKTTSPATRQGSRCD